MRLRHLQGFFKIASSLQKKQHMELSHGSSAALAYPARFYAAASYAGFGGSPESTMTAVTSKFSNDVALLLYGLYQQATTGSCNVPKPKGCCPIEQSKWTSWNGLGDMASIEAMRLFVKILEEEDPSWYARTSDDIKEHVLDMVMDMSSNIADWTDRTGKNDNNN